MVIGAFDGEGERNITLEFDRGPDFLFEYKFGPIKMKFVPQIAVWMEDTLGRYQLHTIYVTESFGRQKWKYFKSLTDICTRTMCLPYWFNRYIAADNPPPTPKAPLPDAITGATPEGSFCIRYSIPDTLQVFKLFVEWNHALDDNGEFAGKEHRLNGQPSAIACTRIDLDDTTRSADTLRLVGRGGETGVDGKLYHDTEMLTTALSVFKSIVARRERSEDATDLTWLIDSLQMDSLRLDLLRMDSLRFDSLYRDSLKTDSLRKESLRNDSLLRETLRLDSLHRESMKTDSLRRELLQHDSLRRESLKKDSLIHDPLIPVRKLAEKHWGSLFHSLEPISSKSLKFVFGAKEMYRVVIRNRVAGIAGPSEWNGALVMDNGAAGYIGDSSNDDEAAVAMIMRQAVRIGTTKKAWLLVDAFADLMGYRECSPDKFECPSDYSRYSNSIDNGWVLSIALETAARGGRCRRYTLCASENGTLSIIEKKDLYADKNRK